MKSLTRILTITLALCFGAEGQTSTGMSTAAPVPPLTVPPKPIALPADTLPVPAIFSLDILTNIPFARDLKQAKFSVDSGAQLQNGNIQNFLDGTYYFRTNWTVTAGILNDPGTPNVVNAARLLVGHDGAWENVRAGVRAGIQRNFNTNSVSPKPSTQVLVEVAGRWHVIGQTLDAYTALDFLSDRSRPFGKPPEMVGKFGLSASF